jgi:hypothetical protein
VIQFVPSTKELKMAKYYDAPDYEDADEIVEEPPLTVRDLINYLSSLDPATEVEFCNNDGTEEALNIDKNLTFVDCAKISALSHYGNRKFLVFGE